MSNNAALTLQRVRPETDDVWSFVFTTHSPFTWLAGQSIRLEIAGPYGPLEHRFSISSAPSSGELTVTTRRSDSMYKKSLFAMLQGATAHAYGLEGDFIWRESTQPHLLLAAGIGITPYYAMLTERVMQSQPINAHLLYSSATARTPFKTQLEQLDKLHSEFTLRLLPSTRLTATVANDANTTAGQLIYIAGPSAMVDSVVSGLRSAGMPPARLLTDGFTGRLPQLG